MTGQRPVEAASAAQQPPDGGGYLRRLAEHFAAAGATRIVLRELALPPALQDRLRDPGAVARELEEAHRIRRLSGIPFWEALLLVCSRTGRDSTDVVRGAGFHQPASAALDEWELAPDALPRQGVPASRATAAGNILTVLSRMQAPDGAWRHLPLLDFRVPAGRDTEPLVRDVSAALGGGLLTRSGSSYHLFGARLVEQHDLHAWLGLAAQYNPVTDGRWIAHQHREGACALRVSPRGRDKPTVVGTVEAQ